ncbi:SPOR domain-containing protein [Lentibacillus salinarum]|uniref:SPOR domain-containing protein n=1 Tax=Lentibacillus salinarum TaxID=446820 RepID=A0ABW3ZXC3_9BACI
MSKGNKLVIWMNGKKTQLTQNDKTPDEKHAVKEFNDEHAAAIEDSDIPELIRQDDDQDNEVYFTRKSKFKAFKPFLLASLSAIVIGSVLGFFLLNMFVGINDDMSQQGGNMPQAATGAEEDEADNQNDANGSTGSDSEDSTTAEIGDVSAFVLQAGKFGEQANADDMAATFQDAGYPAVVWEKEGYFYILSGIAGTKQQGEQLANDMADEDLEVYVKAWETASAKMDLPKSEKEWLQTYEQQWNDSLAAVNDGDRLSKEAWANVVDKTPEKTEHITDFAAFVTKQQQQMGEGDKWQDQQVLLSLWEQFNQLTVQ